MLERLRWALVGPVSLLATVALVTAPKTAGTCAADEAAVWVREHHGNLPSTLAALRPFGNAHRAAILRHLEPTVRARIWQEHVDEILARPGLTAEQRSFLSATKDSFPVLFALTPDLTRARANPIVEIGERVLGRDLFIEAFIAIAPPASFVESQFAQAGLLAGAQAMALTAVGTVTGKGATGWPPCNCTFSGSTTGCTKGGCEWAPTFDCEEVQACGWGQYWYCNGRCGSASEQ